ncbi:MAG: UDP-3-O-(3-hydroxymyristoyl)glucosamine N-acyltransferase [Gemmatimonadetes bacterium]|nr:UDP-3-O-(3-hydroxymyristoyl)glucosamine N-acyltransferase [Gemmatimonadota bacterium]
MTATAAPAPGLAVESAALTAAEIASASGGALVGDGATTVHAVAPLDRAEPGDLSFCSGEGRRAALAATRASVVLLSPALAHLPCGAASRVTVANPMGALVGLLPRLYRPPVRPVGVHRTVVIGRGAQLGAEVALGPYVVIGAGAVIGDRAWIEAGTVIGDGVQIGSDVRLHPGVTLYSGTVLGNRVQVHAGTRLGSDGFGYVFTDGEHRKIPHVGRLLVGDDVEIGANSTIDRGSIDDTAIGAGSKIDNLVHIAHNCRIGRLCLVAAQVGLAGSTTLGDGVILAGQVGLADHLTLGDRARIGGGSRVFGNVPAGETWTGYPARPHMEFLRTQASLYRLAVLTRRLERLVEDGQ